MCMPGSPVNVSDPVKIIRTTVRLSDHLKESCHDRQNCDVHCTVVDHEPLTMTTLIPYIKCLKYASLGELTAFRRSETNVALSFARSWSLFCIVVAILEAEKKQEGKYTNEYRIKIEIIT